MSEPAPGLSVSVRGHVGSFLVDVAFDAPMRGVTALFGASGCGKTTILRCLAGLTPIPGRVIVADSVWQDTAAGLCLPPHHRRVGYVFQEASLFPHLDVRSNLLFGAKRSGQPDAAIDREFATVVDVLGIADLVDRNPATLSGGERQRVALGRALLSAPQVLLMDEPLSALDRPTKEAILPYVERIADTLDRPIIYVTHDIAEVARLARRVVVMGKGRIVRAGPTAEIFGSIETAHDGHVIGASAILDTRIAAQHTDGLTELHYSGGRLHVPRIPGNVGDSVRVRLPAQDVMIARDEPVGISALNILPVVVEHIRIGDGPGAVVRLRSGRDAILARVTQRSLKALQLEVGKPCFAVVKAVAIAKADVGSALPPVNSQDAPGPP